MSRIITQDNLFTAIKEMQADIDRLERALGPIGYHRVGISTATDPISPPFENQYDNYQPHFTLGANPSNYAMGGWSPAFFYKLNGRVFVHGLVWTKSTVGGQTIFTLPVGYRPILSHLTAQYGNAGPARLDVASTGAVSNQSGSGFSTTAGAAIAGSSWYLSIEFSFPLDH